MMARGRMPVSTPTSTVCPRCEAPIRGNFRFCPECAYRLRPGPRSAPEAPATPARGLNLSVVLLLAALTAGAFFAGRELFREPDIGPGVEDEVLRVVDIPNHLVFLPAAPSLIDVGELRWDPLPPEEAWLRVSEAIAPDGGRSFVSAAHAEPALLFSVETLLGRWLSAVEQVLDDTSKPVPRPVQTRPFHILSHEVTRSQYAEFLEDVLERPDLLRRLDSLRMLWSPEEGDPLRDERYLSEVYITYWWQAVQGHLREAALRNWREDMELPRDPERPAWLRTPLPPALGARLLVPPHWVTGTGAADAFSWQVAGDPNWPVTEVSWFDAEAFALWASHRLGMSLRLPTDLEWQRAFHRGNPYRSPEEPGWRYPWGRERRDWACNNLNYWQRYMNQQVPQLLPVLTLFPGDEAFRREGLLHSMAGNAAEWLANSTYDSRGDGPLLPVDTEEYADGRYLDLARRGGGSYRMGISDCALDAMVSRPKGERTIDAGFRLLVRDL